jgi:hypothetical protein
MTNDDSGVYLHESLVVPAASVPDPVSSGLVALGLLLTLCAAKYKISKPNSWRKPVARRGIDIAVAPMSANYFCSSIDFFIFFVELVRLFILSRGILDLRFKPLLDSGRFLCAALL